MKIKGDILILGDVYAGLDCICDNSISVAITSPPYWKQRNYKFDGQIGQEKTPEEYIGRLVKIFRRLRKKLKNDGIFFLNIGDKYLSRYGKSYLLQIPYRLAYHMVRDGWHLEDIIIWYKPNHMPSSVKDRFTNTYEPIFVFAKKEINIYKKNYPKVVEIPLQQTPWKHTAVYPEKLVWNMLNRANLKSGDLILDPFAGTGTTAVVVNKLREILKIDMHSIMIEKDSEFADIIRERTRIKNVLKVNDIYYNFEPIKEASLPNNINSKLLLRNRYGEVYIAQDRKEFLSLLKGIGEEDFKKFHREDAIFFFGIENWDLDSLYYAYIINQIGYVLRNMIVVSKGDIWYPVFMFARDSKRVAYRFFLDRVRVKPKTKDVIKCKWEEESFLGLEIKDLSGKKLTTGYIEKIIKTYDDGFPKLVMVSWKDKVSLEFVLHPKQEEILMEGVKFLCPNCYTELLDPYDPIGDNYCSTCGQKLWLNLETIPIVQEPQEICEIEKEIANADYSSSEIPRFKALKKRNKFSSSKFLSLDRINWGASPGARKLVLGEYFTKMRLYRISQPLIAQYLNLLRKSKKMSIKDIANRFPKNYYHTVGHWFRKDFGGSIPKIEDIVILEEILGDPRGLLRILKRTALKLQTVKNSSKGKNPGDFLRSEGQENLLEFLSLLYLPSTNYIDYVKSKELMANSKQ